MRLTPFALAVCLASVACSGAQKVQPGETAPGVVVPVPIADGERQPASPPVRSAASARPGGSAPPASAPPAASAAPAPDKIGVAAPPDPEALRTTDQIEYTLIYEKGAVRVGAVRRLLFLKPIVTARKMGRYAVELWVGRELIERVRFDFPMLAAEEPTAGRSRSLREPPPLTKGPIEVTLLVPFSDRARRAVLLDRATGKELELTWPPVVTPAPPASASPTPPASANPAPSAPAPAAPAKPPAS